MNSNKVVKFLQHDQSTELDIKGEIPIHIVSDENQNYYITKNGRLFYNKNQLNSEIEEIDLKGEKVCDIFISGDHIYALTFDDKLLTWEKNVDVHQICIKTVERIQPQMGDKANPEKQIIPRPIRLFDPNSPNPMVSTPNRNSEPNKNDEPDRKEFFEHLFKKN